MNIEENVYKEFFKEFYELMIKEYKEVNYNEFIELVRVYCKLPKIGLDKETLYKYVIALLKTSQEKEAMDILNIIFKLSEDTKTSCISDKRLYRIGMHLYFKGLYEEAKIAFIKYLELNKSADKKYIISSKNYLNEIKRHEEGLFNKIKLSTFLADSNNFLQAGMVVYVHNYVPIKINDPKKHSRPYLIWKVNDETIFAFPISSATTNLNTFCLDESGELKRLFREVITFRPDDISAIYRLIDEQKLEYILEEQYIRYKEGNENNIFVEEYEKKLNTRRRYRAE